MTRRYVTTGKTYNRSNNSRNNGRVYYNNNTSNRKNNYGSRKRYTKVTRRYVTTGRSNNSRNNGRVYYNNTSNRNNYGARNTKKSYSNNRADSRSFNTQPQVKYFGLYLHKSTLYLSTQNEK